MANFLSPVANEQSTLFIPPVSQHSKNLDVVVVEKAQQPLQFIPSRLTIPDYYESIQNNFVQRLFSAVPSVEAIYKEILQDYSTFWIITNEPQYDSDLMRRLLSVEVQIHDSYPQSAINFEYLPLALCDNSRDLFGENALLLFQR